MTIEVPYRRVNNRPLHQILVEQITRRIVSGELEPGAALPTEPVLSEQFGVSRTVVREAVRILVSKGLLEVRQGSGMRILPPDRWDYLDPLVLFEQVRSGRGEELLDEVLEVRRLLEVEAAGMAAERRTAEELDGLRECLQRMKGALDDPNEYTRLDIEFHDRILSASRNRLLREALRPVTDVLKAGRFITNRNAIRLGGRAQKSQLGHEAVYGAIEQQDAEAAREAMRGHVRQFERDIRASLSSSELREVAAQWTG
jgi:DNA-binding FadR family transcriptional regulator